MGTDVCLLIELPSGFGAGDDLLGSRWDVPGAPTACTLVFPRRPAGAIERWDDSYEGRYLQPPDLGADTGPVDERWSTWLVDDDPDGAARDSLWGQVFHWDPPNDVVIGATVDFAVAVARFDGEVEVRARDRWAFVQAVHDVLEGWLTKVRDWIEIRSGRLIRTYDGSGPRPTSAQALPLAVDPNTSRAVDFARPRTVRMSIYREPWPVGFGDFAAAVELVAAGTDPDLARVLLRDGQLAQFNRDRRRAVIDAASASEVALSSAIRAHLAVMPSVALDALLGLLHGVDDLYRYHSRVVAPISSVRIERVRHRLAGVRNNVAHAGYVPTPEETNAALEVASLLISELAPLP